MADPAKYNLNRPPKRAPGTPPKREPDSTKAKKGLDEIRLMTMMMRDHQDQITKIGQKRKAVILRLREQNVTYAKIADAMGTSIQAVYKVIRDDI